MNGLKMCSQTNPLARETNLNLSIFLTRTTTASTPSSPGTSSTSVFPGLPLIQDDLKASEIEPPTRPKSTPFSWQETTNGGPEEGFTNDCDPAPIVPVVEGRSRQTEGSSKLTFSRLPTEVHELILDHLFGIRASTANGALTCRGWSTALRHSRRRQLSDVALVNRSYRELVQTRLFKHSV